MKSSFILVVLAFLLLHEAALRHTLPAPRIGDIDNNYSGGEKSESTKHNNPLSQSLESTDSSLCKHLAQTYDGLGQGGYNQQAYDTARVYMEHCAQQKESYQAFLDIDGYNTERSNDLHRFEEYREWLKKVLYLNTNEQYYCQDVNSILHTFTWFNDVRGRDHKGALAIEYFLVKTKRCGYQYIDSVNIPATWNALYKAWQDTVKNPDLTPFDSTLPSIDDLGLGILRGQSGVNYLPSSHSSIIGALFATENPFTNETSVRIKLNDAALLKLEIFDVLGKKLYSDSKFFEQGDESWRIDGKDLPHETVYARVSTMGGEVKTVKLVHH